MINVKLIAGNKLPKSSFLLYSIIITILNLLLHKYWMQCVKQVQKDYYLGINIRKQMI